MPGSGRLFLLGCAILEAQLAHSQEVSPEEADALFEAALSVRVAGGRPSMDDLMASPKELSAWILAGRVYDAERALAAGLASQGVEGMSTLLEEFRDDLPYPAGLAADMARGVAARLKVPRA